MTRKSRTVLFIICLFLFFFSAPVIVFYSQGYRFDFERRKITKTGAFYFKVVPKNVQIYLDSQLGKKTDFFFGSVLIENLLPRKYRVTIEKEGYLSWKKTLETKEKQVTEAKNIVLIPNNPKLFVVDRGIKNFYVSPNKKKIILEKTNGKGWLLEFYDLTSNTTHSLVNNNSFPEKNPVISNLIFSPDSNIVLINSKEKETSRYFFVDFYSAFPAEKTPPFPNNEYVVQALTPLDSFSLDPQRIIFNPDNPQKIFVSAKKAVLEMDLTKTKISLPLVENIIDYQVFDKNIYYLDTLGFVFKTDSSFRLKEKINPKPFPLKSNTEYYLRVFKDFVFIEEEQNLYLFYPDSQEFKKFFETAKEFVISPDAEKLALASPQEIWVLFLKEKFDQPQKKAGEITFLTRFSENMGNIFWLTSHYLIFSSGNKIKITEIDDRDELNIVDLNFQISSNNSLLKLENPIIFWNDFYKKIYILDNGILYFSENII